jgi:uncharacterized Zn finger protein
MDFKNSEQAPLTLPMSLPCTCTHSRLISDSVSEEEHEAGMVRCVECGSVIPDPQLQREAKET